MAKKRKKKKHQYDIVQCQYTVPFSVEEDRDFQEMIQDEELIARELSRILKVNEDEKDEMDRLISEMKCLGDCYKPLDSEMYELPWMKAVKIQNIYTGEIMEFMNMTEFMKHFKISDKMYVRFIKGERVKCLSDWKLTI